MQLASVQLMIEMRVKDLRFSIGYGAEEERGGVAATTSFRGYSNNNMPGVSITSKHLGEMDFVALPRGD